MVKLLVKFPFESLLDNKHFKDEANLLYDPLVRSVVHDIVIRHRESETPKRPVYMLHASHDEIVPCNSTFF